jgi:hypothetical protein
MKSRKTKLPKTAHKDAPSNLRTGRDVVTIDAYRPMNWATNEMRLPKVGSIIQGRSYLFKNRKFTTLDGANWKVTKSTREQTTYVPVVKSVCRPNKVVVCLH